MISSNFWKTVLDAVMTYGYQERVFNMIENLPVLVVRMLNSIASQSSHQLRWSED